MTRLDADRKTSLTVDVSVRTSVGIDCVLWSVIGGFTEIVVDRCQIGFLLARVANHSKLTNMDRCICTCCCSPYIELLTLYPSCYISISISCMSFVSRDDGMPFVGCRTLTDYCSDALCVPAVGL